MTMVLMFNSTIYVSIGLNCLHIAAQFGFTSIVAYMVTHPRFAIVSYSTNMYA